MSSRTPRRGPHGRFIAHARLDDDARRARLGVAPDRPMPPSARAEARRRGDHPPGKREDPSSPAKTD